MKLLVSGELQDGCLVRPMSIHYSQIRLNFISKSHYARKMVDVSVARLYNTGQPWLCADSGLVVVPLYLCSPFFECPVKPIP